MADETYLQAQAVERVAQDLANASREFGNAMDELTRALERDDGCWSDDRIGRQFQQKYVPAATQNLAVLRQLQQGLANTGTKALPTVVELLQRVDSDNGRALNSYLDQIGEVLQNANQRAQALDPKRAP
ncbi:hypothetical protein GCM10011581_02900 [Saccharopolyspora subtropica]|uniref:WXG100 family type VII secretion target n=1 Tax=Saccharopolyspora thermophila TaxID=89367 RepID=A0A917JIV0_9PSEU|nr:hypothetical protein [Saccharopolyspora subtropica]GGI69319.1 hypothetical protein GCM10011581_02900 [Saccharopolyspora subtropica]